MEPNDAFHVDKQKLAELAAAGDVFNEAKTVLEPEAEWASESSGNAALRA